MKEQNIHFVGIGGIGVSALAQWYKSRGWRVSGSDLEASEITEALAADGIPVAIGSHKKESMPQESGLLIHTAAASSNPEIRQARKRKIPVKTYAEALGALTREHLTIAVAGSHGKSTTTALISLILAEAGFDPTVILGTKLREFAAASNPGLPGTETGPRYGSNFRKGRSGVMVIEADEWKGAFWNYSPALLVITNVDREHLDFYKTYPRVLAAFRKFILKTRAGAKIVVNADDEGASKVARALIKKHPRRFKKNICFYSLASPEAPYVRSWTALPGRHNASNAMAAHTVAKILNVPEEITEKVLSDFKGAWRRFELVGNFGGSPVIADYAHHPTEIRSTLQAARAHFGKKKIIAVFQPHHYERTKNLFGEFTKSFDEGDVICLLDIYEVAGREKKRRNRQIHSFNLTRELSKRKSEAYHVPYPSQLREFIAQEAGPDSVILMMGAGSIWDITKKLVE